MILQPTQQSAAQARLVGAAVRRRDGVAVGMDEAVCGGEPRDRPLDRAVSSRSRDPAGEDLIGDEGLALDVRGKVVLEASGKMKHRLRRRLASLAEQRGSAAPADLDPAKQVSLG